MNGIEASYLVSIGLLLCCFNVYGAGNSVKTGIHDGGVYPSKKIEAQKRTHHCSQKDLDKYLLGSFSPEALLEILHNSLFNSIFSPS